MSDLGTAKLELRAGDARFDREMKGAERKARGLTAAFKKATVALAAIGGAAIALRQVSRFAQEAIKLFGIQEEAEVKLAAALRATGKAGDEAFSLITKRASEMQKATTFGDEAIIKASSSLALFANELTAIEIANAQRGIIGLAEVLGTDLNQAALQMGKSIASTTNSLIRYKIEIDTTALQSEKLRQILAQTTGHFDLAKAAADTTRGRLIQLQNAWGDTKEAMGLFLDEGLKLTEWLEKLIELLDKLSGMVPSSLQILQFLTRFVPGPIQALGYAARGVMFDPAAPFVGPPAPAGYGPPVPPRPRTPADRRRAAFLAGQLLPVSPIEEELKLKRQLIEVEAEYVAAMEDATEGVSGLNSMMSGQLAGSITGVVFGLNSMTDAMENLIKTVLQVALQAGVSALLPFHSGGIVPGTMPILAHAGEVVLSRSAVAAMGGAHAANAMNRQGSLNINVDLTGLADSDPDIALLATMPGFQRLMRRAFDQLKVTGNL